MFKQIIWLFAGFFCFSEALKCYQCTNMSNGCPDAQNSTTTEEKDCHPEDDVCFQSMYIVVFLIFHFLTTFFSKTSSIFQIKRFVRARNSRIWWKSSRRMSLNLQRVIVRLLQLTNNSKKTTRASK